MTSFQLVSARWGDYITRSEFTSTTAFQPINDFFSIGVSEVERLYNTLTLATLHIICMNKNFRLAPYYIVMSSPAANNEEPTAQSSQVLEDSIVLRMSLMALLVQLDCLNHVREGEAVVRVKYDAKSFQIIEVQIGRD